jgi:hypothetical protein
VDTQGTFRNCPLYGVGYCGSKKIGTENRTGTGLSEPKPNRSQPLEPITEPEPVFYSFLEPEPEPKKILFTSLKELDRFLQDN